MNMIVTYDIANPKRLSRVAKIMKDYGVRVQKSIFELTTTHQVFEKMKARLEKEMELSEDGVKYFPVCEKCAGTVEIIGQGSYIDPDEAFYVI